MKVTVADYRDKSFIERNVDKSGECWNWTGAKNDRGYGHFCVSRKGERPLYIKAHRAAYSLFKEDGLDSSQHVLHSCDNPACCNPAHLRVGTHADNMEDMRQKGRAIGHAGAKNPRAKLTSDQVDAIRQEGKTMAYWRLGAKYGVHGNQIRSILLGKTWASSEAA